MRKRGQYPFPALKLANKPSATAKDHIQLLVVLQQCFHNIIDIHEHERDVYAIGFVLQKPLHTADLPVIRCEYRFLRRVLGTISRRMMCGVSAGTPGTEAVPFFNDHGRSRERKAVAGEHHEPEQSRK